MDEKEILIEAEKYKDQPLYQYGFIDGAKWSSKKINQMIKYFKRHPETLKLILSKFNNNG